MKKIVSIVCLCISLAGLAASASSPQDADPVILLVNDREVRLSEFEYLYHKNNQQQLQPLSVTEYLGLFVDYKLKVAEALAQGIDTTATFRQELSMYRQELIEAYASDNNISVTESEKKAEEDTNMCHLINEYHDGILLFEISNENVWRPAAENVEGQKKYYSAHKKKYKWAQPRFKGYVMRAKTDSLLAQARQYADQINPDGTDAKALVQALSDKFGSSIKISRLVAAEGDYPITDYLCWGKNMPMQDAQQWKAAILKGEVINQPEEFDDVKSLVISDYQNALERNWLKALKKKHKVKINKKALKTCK